MISKAADYLFLTIAAAPFIYYVLVLYSSWLFFRRSKNGTSRDLDFTPPVSNLKPVRGLDPEAYENFASYCRQDYPDYELIFCVGDENDASVPILQKLMRDFPECQIRILYGSGRNAINDKVAKLVRMVNEARNEVLVINDSDVRVEPNYLRTVVAPLRDPKVGGVTCLYVSTQDKTFTQHLQSVGMISDFYPGILVARQLDGIKFDLGQIRCVAFRRLDLRHLLRWRWAGGQTAGEEEQQERDELCFSHSGSPEWRHFTVVEIRRVAQIVSECSGVGLWFARTSLAWVTLLRKSSALPNTKLRSLRRHNWFVNAGARLSAEDVNGPLPQR